MNLLSAFIDHIQSRRLFTMQDHLLLAVSGGADSVILCELCHQAGFTFSIAHCNFQLRGAESERDETFVQQLAARYQVPLHNRRFDTVAYADAQSLSTQEAARELRYAWFSELIAAYTTPAKKAIRLLTAHHADDNAETVLMHFFRGTGLTGLTGIPAKGNEDTMYGLGPFLRRPLLPFFKEQLLQFAKEHQLEWVEDSSNQLSKYTRNYIRHDILPAIAKVYPQVKENLKQNSERFTEINQLYELATAAIIKKLCRQKGNEVHIPVKQLMSYQNKALIYQVISPYGFTEKQIPDLVNLAIGESGKYITAPGSNYRIIRHRHWLIISPAATPAAENIIIEKEERSLIFPDGVLELSHSSKQVVNTSEQVANLDAALITYPLLLRRWKAGDYFYPLGMRKKKKVARFLIDQKLSKSGKEKVWVLEMNQKIIWVVGYRIDDRFKVTDQATKQLKLVYTPTEAGNKGK